MFAHKVLRVNYTTYDVRRAQDSINPTSRRRDIMVYADEDQSLPHAHPFWYARVLGVFHAWVVHSGEKSKSLNAQRMEFVWVRWMGRDSDARSRGGWKTLRLDRVGFVPHDADSAPFGFLDPAHILRGAHLIPAFAHGRTDDLLQGPTLARDPGELDDWQFFYVNRFVIFSY